MWLGEVLLAYRPTYTLLCIYKSSKQTGALPGGSGRRATLLGNVDRANRKLRCGRNRPSGWTLSVQVFGPGGTRSEYRSRICWIDGRRTRAAAEAPQRKRPCRSRATARRSLLRHACVKRCKGQPESVRCGANRELPGEGEKVRSPCSRCKIP